jgi:membrane associated rhomboid family serine protease
MPAHLFIIATISIISIIAFYNYSIIEKLEFNAWQILRKREYYRLFTHAFVHGGWMHLLFNMFVLFSFGGSLIMLFEAYLGVNGGLMFLILFMSAIPISSLYSLKKEKNNLRYNAVGASGAVTAVLFASIFLEPYSGIAVFPIPFPIPGIIFGVIYLVYSKIMADRNVDNIGHDAHFWGALYGFFFPVLLEPQLAKLFFYKLFSVF